jgi:hypothetical protein
MKPRCLFALVVLSMCGCQSGPVNPVVWVLNRLTQTNCVARKLPPGSTWIDNETGGWVQLGEDGKVRPIPPPDEEGTPSPAPRSEPSSRNR